MGSLFIKEDLFLRTNLQLVNVIFITRDKTFNTCTKVVNITILNKKTYALFDVSLYTIRYL